MAAKTYGFTILLLKDGFGPVQSLKAGATKAADVTLGGVVRKFHYKQSAANEPGWVKLVRPHTTDPLSNLRNASAAAVLFVEQASRYFALTFGHGRHLLNPDSYEENFGLKVVLNSVDPQKLRSIDAQSLDAVPVQVRSQSGTATALADFGFDVERDLIYAATGQPRVAGFGKQITGKDAVKITALADLGAVPDLVEKVLKTAEADDYKKDFPWVDNLAEVRSPGAKAALDAAFADKIAKKDLTRTWLALPEIIDWKDVAGFKYQQLKRGELHDDIGWESYLEFADGKSITVDLFKQHVVHCVSASTGLPLYEWPIYKCAYCEIDLNGATHTLTNGRWYRVEKNFMSELDQALKSIPTCSVALPDYADKSEGEYNARVAAANVAYFAHFDKKLIKHGNGASKIEFCDLYTTDQHLIHVKRYGGSSVLSHPFSQGLVSANLFLGDGSFRQKVSKLLPATHAIKTPLKKPDAGLFEVVYAIATKDPSGGATDLPLFSKINLRNAYRQITLLNLKCSLAFMAVK